MKKLSIFTICALGLASAALTSCSKQSDEITSYTLNRNLSPIGMQAKNVQESTADIQWTPSANATSYNLRVYAEDSMSYLFDDYDMVYEATGLTEEDIPYTVKDLFFDTKYTLPIYRLSPTITRAVHPHGTASTSGPAPSSS